MKSTTSCVTTAGRIKAAWALFLLTYFIAKADVSESGTSGYITHVEIRVSWNLYSDEWHSCWLDSGDDFVDSVDLYDGDSVSYYDEGYWWYYPYEWTEDEYYVSYYNAEAIYETYESGDYTNDFYQDFLYDGALVTMEPFYVYADAPEYWEYDWENVWTDFLDLDFWDLTESEAWDDLSSAQSGLTLSDTGTPCTKGKEHAQLAEQAYASSPSSVGNNVPQSPSTFSLSSSDVVDATTGFKAVIYQNSVTGKITVSFAGTNGLSDWGANAGQAFGLEAEQYNQAVALAQTMNTYATANSVDLEFVGHSLGGGLASISSLVTNRTGATFNAAGINSDTLSRYSTSLTNQSIIKAWYSEGDVLSAAQDTTPLPDAVGVRTRLDNSSLPWTGLFHHAIGFLISTFPC